jgi:hypothetical protein
MAIDLEKLKSEHGALHEISHDGESVIVKSPNRATWKRFRAQAQDDGKRIIAMEELVRACVVHPERGELEGLLDRRPGLVETFGKALADLAGASDKAEKKAL